MLSADLVSLLQSLFLLLRSSQQTVPRQLKVLYLIFYILAGIVVLVYQAIAFLAL